MSFFGCCVRCTVTCRNVIKSSLFTCCSQLLPQLLMGYRVISSPLGRICLALPFTQHSFPWRTHIPHTFFYPPPSIFAHLHNLPSETFLEAKLPSQTNIVWAISHPTQAIWGESVCGWKDSQRNGWRVRGQRRKPMGNAAANLMTSVEKSGKRSQKQSMLGIAEKPI